MNKQMCWLIDSKNGKIMLLHLRESPYQPWTPYTSHPKYSVPDYKIPGGSKGWATYQHLRKAGWTLIPTAQANNFIIPVTTSFKKAA